MSQNVHEPMPYVAYSSLQHAIDTGERNWTIARIGHVIGRTVREAPRVLHMATDQEMKDYSDRFSTSHGLVSLEINPVSLRSKLENVFTRGVDGPNRNMNELETLRLIVFTYMTNLRAKPATHELAYEFVTNMHTAYDSDDAIDAIQCLLVQLSTLSRSCAARVPGPKMHVMPKCTQIAR
jgi:hypothetical protein